MNTICQFCGARMAVPYFLLGASLECPSCKKRTIPQIPNGTRYPDTGYEITFSDFQRLLSDAADRPAVAPLLRGWFGYEIEQSGDDIRIRSREGDEIDALSLHRRIQANSSQQGTLYRTAMTLWR